MYLHSESWKHMHSNTLDTCISDPMVMSLFAMSRRNVRSDNPGTFTNAYTD